MSYNENKLTKLGALKAFAEKVKADYATKTELNKLSNKVDGLVTAGGEPNKIEKVKVNGAEQTIGSDKSVDIKVPVKVSELSNDSKFQTDTDVSSAVNDAINDFATKVSNDEVVNTFKELVDYAAEHGEEAATMAGDIAQNKSDISQLKTDIAGKVNKDGNKQLSTEDYTTEDKNKLASIEIATKAEVEEMLNEVFTED